MYRSNRFILFCYLDEQAFRYNHREGVDDANRYDVGPPDRGK